MGGFLGVTKRTGMVILSPSRSTGNEDLEMPVITIELDDQLRETIENTVRAHGGSVEEYIVAAAAERVAAEMARERLHRILDRVPHVPPDPGDEL
jgi:hypothetical protein